MRIAVLRPQVPFARGGAEIFTDTSSTSRRAGTTRPRLGAVRRVSGARRADAGVPLADARPRGGGRAKIDIVVGTKFPSTSRAIPRSASGSSTSSARRTSSTGPSSASSALGRGPGAAAPGAGARPDRARRGDAPLRHVRERRRAARAVHQASAEVLPHPPQALPGTGARGPRVRPLGEPPRPREGSTCCWRPAPRAGGRRGGRVGGPDRERLRRSRASAASTAGCASRVASARSASPSSTRRARRSSTRRWTRTSGWGRTRRFSRASRVITTTDAGGPLDVVHDRTTGLVVAPEPAEIGKAAAWLREHPDDAAAFGSPGRRSPTRSPGIAHRETALVSGVQGRPRA